jgi:hypothetical protein
MSDVVRDWIYGDRAGDGGKAYNTKQIIRKREIFGSKYSWTKWIYSTA